MWMDISKRKCVVCVMDDVVRILDKDGNLVKMCRVDVSFAGGKEIPIAVYDPVTDKITSTTEWLTQIRDRTCRFDGN